VRGLEGGIAFIDSLLLIKVCTNFVNHWFFSSP